MPKWIIFKMQNEWDYNSKKLIMGQKTKEQVDSRKFKEEIRMENEHLINLSQHWYMNSIHHLLWFPRRISRHPFIVWLVLLFGWPLYGDFSTHGLIVSSKCVPCGSSFKSHEHPFFNFPFFSYIWGELNKNTYGMADFPVVLFAPMDYLSLSPQRWFQTHLCTVSPLNYNLFPIVWAE